MIRGGKVNKKTEKIIALKQRNLSALNDQAGKIINHAFSFVRSLEAVNSKIEDEMTEIDSLMESMNETKQGLSDTKQKNDKMISNFRKLFEV